MKESESMRVTTQYHVNIWKKTVFLLLILFIGIGQTSSTNEKIESKELVSPSVMGKGTEERNWISEEEIISSERYNVEVEEDVEIPMKDGTILRGRLLLPVGLDKPLPTVVQLNGYGYNGSSEDMLYDLAARGYAALHIGLRGSKGSEGEEGLYNSYGEDGYDVIEWAAEQPWSNGNVGTVGISLVGISQWLAAKELPPSLKAISPVASCADCYDYLWHPGGMEAGPGRVARVEEYESAKNHRNYDDWWKERSVSPEQIKAIANQGIAALISGGWNDYISPGNIKAYEIYSAAGNDGKLIVSPGGHAKLSGVLPYKFDDYQSLWFDHFLKGEENGMEERDPVLIYVQGSGRWRYEKAWPLHDTNYVDLFLSENESGSIDSVNDGSFTVLPSNQKHSNVDYEFTPENGPFLPTLLNLSGRLLADQQLYEKNTVTWTTDELAVPTEITGNISVSFWAEITAGDADFVLQITDVSPYGTSKQVTAGYLSASRSESRTAPAALTPAKEKKYIVEMPTSYVFKEGHRIRLSIAGGAKTLEGQTEPQGPGINNTASGLKYIKTLFIHPD